MSREYGKEPWIEKDELGKEKERKTKRNKNKADKNWEYQGKYMKSEKKI